MRLVFRETPLFSRQIGDLLSDDELAVLESLLLVRPDKGTLIPRSGGLRKTRWRGSGRGKRGGIRVIYYWHVPSSLIYFLFAYAKNEQEDLTPTQLKQMKNAIAEEFP